jgi:hypothetical protein
MADPWLFLPVGYLCSVLVEAPILLAGLSAGHSWRDRLFAGLWLTACTYPIVVLTLPALFAERWAYLVVAETFAPVAECALFCWAFGRQQTARGSRWRDCAVITAANLASFGVGEVLTAVGFWSWLGVG